MPSSLIGPEGVDLGHINVIEFLDSLFDLVLIGLDMYNVHKQAGIFYFLHDWVSCQVELDDGMVVKLVFPGGAPWRIFGLPSESSVLGLEKAGDVQVIFCGCGGLLTFLAFEDFALASALGGARVFFVHLPATFMKGPFNLF